MQATIIYFIGLLFGVSSAAIAFLVPLYGVHLELPAVVMGAVLASVGIFQILGRLPSSWLVERVGERLSIVLALGILTCAAAILKLSASVWALPVAQLVFGLARSMFWTPVHSLLSRIDTSRIGRHMGVFNFVRGCGGLIGPGLVGGMISIWDIGTATTVVLTVLIVGTLIPLLLTPLPPRDRNKGWREMAGHSRRVLRAPLTYVSGWYAFSSGSMQVLGQSFLPYFFASSGMAAHVVGRSSINAGFEALAGLWLARTSDRSPDDRLARRGMIVLFVGLSAVPFTQSVVLLALLVAALGFVSGTHQTLAPTLLGRLMQEELKVLSLGVMGGVFRGMGLLTTPVLSGWVLATFSPVLAFPVLGAFLSGVGMLITGRFGERRPLGKIKPLNGALAHVVQKLLQYKDKKEEIIHLQRNG